MIALRKTSLIFQVTALVILAITLTATITFVSAIPIIDSLTELATDAKQLTVISKSRSYLSELYRTRKNLIELQIQRCLDSASDFCQLSLPGDEGVMISMTPALTIPNPSQTPNVDLDIPDNQPHQNPKLWWTDDTHVYAVLKNVVFTAELPFNDLKPMAAELGQWLATRSHLELVGGDLQRSLIYTLGLSALGSGLFCLIFLRLLSRRQRLQFKSFSTYIRSLSTGDVSEIPDEIKKGSNLNQLAEDVHFLAKSLHESQLRALETERLTLWQTMAKKLAHEIKNPLTPISLAREQIDLLARSIPDQKTSAQLLEISRIIEEETAGLGRMVREFTTFARLPKPEPSPENFIKVIQEFISRNETQDGPKLVFEYTGQPVTVDLDKSMVYQIFHNLVANARLAKFPEQVTVSFSIEHSPTSITLLVADDGPGVDASLETRMFDAYVTSRSTGDREKGMGLGLTMSRQIAQDHGGSLVLRSNSSNGATFALTFNLRTPT